jgi:hypothetical protein
MLETLDGILLANTYTYSVVGVLTVFAGLLVRHMTSSTALAIIYAPALAFGALAGVYYCREIGLIVTFDNNANIVATAGIGMLVACMVMLVLTRLFFMMIATTEKVADPSTRPH